MNKIFVEKIERADRPLMTVIIILVLCGIVMVLSSSSIVSFKRFDAPYGFFYKQIIWSFLGIIGMLVAFYVRIDFIKKSARWLYLAGVIALAAVLVLGKEVNGARRWFNLGILTFQPSEAMKLVMIIFLADYLDRKKSRLKTLKGFARLAFFVALPSGLVLLEPDLGGAMVIALISLAICFLGGVDVKYLAAVFCFALIAAAFSVVTTPYRLARVKRYVSSVAHSPLVMYLAKKQKPYVAVPPTDTRGEGESENVTAGRSDGFSPSQIESQGDAALAAIKRGGWLGVGIGNSRLKMFYLPEPHTDFIFAVIGEEMGYLGAMVIVLLFLFLFMRAIKVALSTGGSSFMSLAAAGVAFYFTIQSVFHIGVSCGLLPTKGLTLPFISFGGSSLLVSFMMAGILLNISTRADMV